MGMRRVGIFCVILMAMSVSNSSAAPVPWKLWRTFVGGSHPDGDRGSEIAVDADDNVYLVGTAADGWGGVCPNASSSFAGDRKAFAVKLDPSGNVVWCSFFGSQAAATGVAVDCDGGLYVTGQSGGSATGGDCLVGTASEAKGFIVKLNKDDGKLEWPMQCVGFSGNAVAVDCSNHVYVAGQAVGEGGPAFAVKLKLGEGGLPENVGECRSSAPSRAHAIALGDESVYVAGERTAQPFVGKCSPVDPPDAIEVFPPSPQLSNIGQAWAIGLDDLGNVYVAGEVFVDGEANVGKQAFLARRDASGAVIGTDVTFGAGVGRPDVATALLVGSGPDAYVVGYSDAPWGSPEFGFNGGVDVWLARVTGDDVAWSSFIGGEHGEWGWSLAHDTEGRIVIAGYGAGEWNEALWEQPKREPTGTDDAFVLKTSLVVSGASCACDDACLGKRAAAWGEYVSCIAAEAGKYYASPGTFADNEDFDGCRSKYFDTWDDDCPRFAEDANTVTDHLTSLVWEKKTRSGDPNGPHHADANYTWSLPYSVTETGTAFSVFLRALNDEKFGSSEGWRLPNLAELQTLMSRSGTGMVPGFPDHENNAYGQYMTATSSPIVFGGCKKESSCAWNVMFTPPPIEEFQPKEGSVGVNGKGTDPKTDGSQHARAVRGGW